VCLCGAIAEHPRKHLWQCCVQHGVTNTASYIVALSFFVWLILLPALLVSTSIGPMVCSSIPIFQSRRYRVDTSSSCDTRCSHRRESHRRTAVEWLVYGSRQFALVKQSNLQGVFCVKQFSSVYIIVCLGVHNICMYILVYIHICTCPRGLLWKQKPDH
jgi:hypothetical protein